MKLELSSMAMSLLSVIFICFKSHHLSLLNTFTLQISAKEVTSPIFTCCHLSLHWKLHALRAMSLIHKHCLVASADLKDVYYSVLSHPDWCKLQRLAWKGCVYQYTAFLYGQALAPSLVQNENIQPL